MAYNINTTIYIVACCLFLTFNLNAQDGDYLNKSFIEMNFKGGYDGYANFFRKNLTFPERSYKDQTEGLLLFKFTFNPAKKTIRYTFLTLLDDQIEAQVRSVLDKLVTEWQTNEDKEFTLYQPIIYSLLPYYPEAFEGEIPEIPVDLPLKFVQPFVLIKSKRIPDNASLELFAEAEVSERKRTYYERALSAYKQLIKKGDTKSAYKVLNQIIRYNPLDKDFLLARIQLENQLDSRPYQSYDVAILKDFVDKANNEYKTISASSQNNTTPGLDFKAPEKGPSIAVDKSLKNIRTNYMGGTDGFIYDFIFYIKHPNSKIKGVSFFKINISPNDEVNFQFLTKLDKNVERNIKAAFEKNEQKWIKRDTAYHQYVACFYSTLPKFSSAFEEKDPAYQAIRRSGELFTVKLQKEEDMITLNSTGMSRQEVERELNDRYKAKRARKDSLDHVVDLSVYMQYEEDIKKYRAQIAGNKTKKAFGTLTELIKLNPFQPFLIEERIRLAEENSKYDEYLEIDRMLLASLEEIYKSAEDN